MFLTADQRNVFQDRITIREAAFRAAQKANSHEIIVVSVDQLGAVIQELPDNTKTADIKSTWGRLSGAGGLAANHYSTVGDVVTLARLVKDLGGLKGIKVEAYVKNYAGKPHIIIKGYPGLRKIFTATKYGITHPKVLAMGLGYAAAKGVARAGGMLTVVLMTGYRVIDYVLTDKATLSQLIGRLATDIVKIGITVGLSIATAAGVGLLTSVAIGPLFAVIVIGVAGSWALEELDAKFGITENLINAIEERTRYAINGAGKSASTVVRGSVDYVVDTARRVAINWAKSRFRPTGRFK